MATRFTRLAKTCATGLRPLEEGIRTGLRERLESLPTCGRNGATNAAAPCVAVMGRPSAEFSAAIRATRAEGMVAAPMDARWRTTEELAERLAEARVRLALIAGVEPGGSEEATSLKAAQQIGASTALAAQLQVQGASSAAALATSLSEPTANGTPDPAAMLMFSSMPGLIGPARAAEISPAALSARVVSAVNRWSFGQGDVVLPLGLLADTQCALIDSLEAPLAAGCSIVLPEPRRRAHRLHRRSSNARRVSGNTPEEMWASLLQASDTTVVFVASECVSRLLHHHASVAVGLRAELAARWREKPLRLSVALASPGCVPSQEQSQRWLELFGCRLHWHYGCPEAGALFTVGGDRGHPSAAHAASCIDDHDWHVEGGELRVKGKALFERYLGRPRSTSEAFNTDGFCRTGHRVGEESRGLLHPQPNVFDPDVVVAMEKQFRQEPNVEGEGRQTMRPNWKIKTVPIRKYEYWRTAWGGVLPTKKHNTAHKVYKGKYK